MLPAHAVPRLPGVDPRGRSQGLLTRGRIALKLASQGFAPVRSRFLPFHVPPVGRAESEEVSRAIDSGWITTGPRVAELEKRLAEWLEGTPVLCVDSGTAAMHLAVVAAGLGPGDEVITTPFTFCATVNVILHAGATPVLADVDPRTLNLDPATAEAAVTPGTRGLLPVHYAGEPCDMDRFLDLARRRDLFVLEDAAHAIGARYRGRKIGSLGPATAFSFYATKNMTTGEGGALASPDEALLARARTLALHGMSADAWDRYTDRGSWYYEVVAAGFKYNMSDVAAAIGLPQLARLEANREARARIAARYDAAFAGMETLDPVGRDPASTPAHHLYPVLLSLERLRIDRAGFLRELRAENIGTSVHFIPIHLHPYYRDRLGLRKGMFPVAENAYERIFSLPIYPGMTDRDADDVVEAVLRVSDAYRA